MDLFLLTNSLVALLAANIAASALFSWRLAKAVDISVGFTVILAVMLAIIPPLNWVYLAALWVAKSKPKR